MGCGSATPSQIVSNEQLGLRVETNDAWIRSRTGICERRVISPGETLSSLSAKAAENAMQMAKWDPDTIDLLILATSTPDDLFGSAPQIQAEIGAKNAVAFDLTAACSGFLFSLVTASQFLKTGNMKRALVIGADQLTRWVDWDDRRSCVLFGDGAGAIALEGKYDEDDGLIDFKLRSDGSRGNCLNLSHLEEFETLIPGVDHQKGGFSNVQMNGQEVYKFAVREVPAILEDLLNNNQISADQLDWLLLHQANQRILNSVAERFSIPSQKVLSNLSSYGNTSAATIPLMLDEAVKDGRVQPGDLIASSGFGAGLSWGAALFRWHGPT
tara:strand:+ start:729 stop:1709 length:981 start_codon:yes stop_codon:yes gene_type:complete